MKHLILLFFSTLVLTGCVYDNSNVLRLSNEYKKNLNVSNIKVIYSPEAEEKILAADEKYKLRSKNKNAELGLHNKSIKAVMESTITEYIEAIDSENTNHASIEVEIIKLRFPNTAVAVIIGDTYDVHTRVRIYNKKKDLIANFNSISAVSAAGPIDVAVNSLSKKELRSELSQTLALRISRELGFLPALKKPKMGPSTNSMD